MTTINKKNNTNSINWEQIAKEVEADDLSFLDKILSLPSLSIERLFKELEFVSSKILKKAEDSPDSQILSRATTLLELKAKMLGLLKVEPKVQEIIDAEINSYKEKLLTTLVDILNENVKPKIRDKILNSLGERIPEQ